MGRSWMRDRSELVAARDSGTCDEALPAKHLDSCLDEIGIDLKAGSGGTHEGSPSVIAKQRAEFDAHARSYSEDVNRALAFTGFKVDFFTRVKADDFVELLDTLPLSASSADVLDVGCGVANSHPLLSGRVGTVVGIDVSKQCLATAGAQNPLNQYEVYDGQNIPYKDHSFDAASAVCVFHHIPVASRLALVRDVRRVLRPHGFFAIYEHNPFNPLTSYVVKSCEFDKNAILLRSNEAEALLHAAGFHSIETRFILTVPAKGMLRQVDRLFARLPFGAQYCTVGRVS
jgi:SAM-dependent methyltransferase